MGIPWKGTCEGCAHAKISCRHQRGLWDSHTSFQIFLRFSSIVFLTTHIPERQQLVPNAVLKETGIREVE